ncbi:CRISPR-associated endonuclease Cas2 [Peptostreptococcus sp.]|jgi:hypothetical protein|uniref:CRISPR-associated endonuclease Cas2 n=1 Tax=Peptostreptococcus sp. TaxID=1262 RepID=UPI0025D6EB58|nr:CRISPR-associated endonuclease Cas2 [Peptostreptococcus sp.]
MSYRFMRILVMFDLPVQTSDEQKQYRHFRKYLISCGFMMMQESIYCKLALNQGAAMHIANAVKRNKPKSGLVQILTVTEKQFSKMEIIVGEINSDVVDTDKRVLVL